MRMTQASNDDEPAINVSVARYYIARLRAAQALVPLVAISSIVARRHLEPTAVTAAVALQIGTLVTFLGARRGFGWQPLRIAHGAASFGADLQIARHRVLNWTQYGRLVRIYCDDLSLRLQARDNEADVLGERLQSWLGAPLQMERRGSKRARILSLVAAVAGLLLVVLAVTYSTIALIVLGLPCFIFGLGTFGALSQRVARI
jgi:hypothetical protein